jgi:Subtilase family/Secretion system C-terminal sorting domain
MRPNPIPLIASLLFASLAAIAQKDSTFPLLLKSGSFIPERNISALSIEQYDRKANRIDGKIFSVIQFEHIPTLEERKELSSAGIELLQYIPGNAYSVSIKNNLSAILLQKVKARSIIDLKPEQKMHPLLAKGIIPAWSVKLQGTVDVWISYSKALSFEILSKALNERNFTIISTVYKNYNVIALRIGIQRISELASLPFIDYVQPAPHEDQTLTDISRIDVRANVLNAPLSVGGRNLKGDGVVIGIGDNSDPQTHIDFNRRLIDRAAATYAYHGTHVHGIAGGGGIVNELNTGFAPKATLISQVFNGVFTNAPAYVQDYGMVITNNSYGAITGDCSYTGLYDLYSRILDQQAFDFPNLQNVFAAGNSGYDDCPPYPIGFKTVLGSYQSAKNVLTVGNTYGDGTLFPQSSRGPVQDGRIKPEIVTNGSFVQSTVSPGSSYGNNTGTSMAAPAAAGGLALLYQRYRQLNGGANPKSGLMKALVCNGGRDLGNDGPDYSHGFGWMNLERSVDMMENNHYFISTLTNGNNNTHNIIIPANTAQLNVMLYWNDPAAAVFAAHTLVNDLDLEVSDPSSTIILPRKLDTIPANITNVATTGADHINNIEQVTITNPATGNYTVTIKGTAITQNPPQEYFVVFDIVPVETKLTFPIGGESFVPGSTVIINWDSYGDPANTFTAQYSTDNGTTWVDINTNVAANLRYVAWIVPAVNTDQGLVRVLRNGTAIVSTSQVFTILGIPTVSLSATQCEDYFGIDWTAIPGATDYEVMMLQGREMTSVVTTAATSYTFSGLSKDTTYWVTVRARLNGNPGRRAIAISRQPNTGTCAGTISDNDMKMDAILSPSSGRKFTSTELSSAVTLSVRIKNLDDAPVNNFDMKYSVNGGAWVSENVSTTVAGGAVYTHNFATPLDLSAVGNYQIKIVVKNTTPDGDTNNDTLTSTIRQIDNQPISLASAFLDDIESATEQSSTHALIGLDGIDRYDFSNSTSVGRVRSFVNTGIAYSGSKALTLDEDRYYPAGNTNFLNGTFNLGTYNEATNDIRLDFQYKNHGQSPNANNKVWVRGADSQPWIAVYDLYNNQNDPGLYKLSSSIEVSDFLGINSQNFTSSFQIRWGQWGQIQAGDNETGNGYTFDNIRLYEVFNDIQMIRIDTPITASCGLNANTPVKVSVRNSSNSIINNIPVQFRVDGGTIISETIPSIAGKATIQYTFTAPADLSVLGSHTLEVWVSYPTDSYRNNDTASVSIINSPIINSYPHLENFESGNGQWYAGGIKSSWEYGIPASNKIKSAASGTKAWKTRLVGNYNDLENSYLYSPCYDISGMTNPTLSFSVALDLEDCGASLCDAAFVEYSADGITWTKLGSAGTGTNWYNKSTTNVWSIEDYTRWHVATQALPAGLTRLRLRFVVQSDQYVNREGIAIDDIHIYDNTMGIYNGVTMGSPVTQNIPGGTNWIDFVSGGKLVASIQPNNQNMGNTDVQAYINTGPVRNYNGQYYHDRNITIKPASVNLSDSVTIRFYFLDRETDSLIFATGCGYCTKPANAYELGVSKYDDTDDNIENGLVSDDVQGNWSFINSLGVKKVPFDKGYYAEFKVKDFSEFWLNDGGFDDNHPLPVQLLSFTAKKKTNNDVIVEWTTAAEFNVDRFEIEIAKGNSQLQINNFVKAGEIDSHGNSAKEQSYNFIDVETNKSGVRYYRLKIIDKDGNYRYSAIRPIVFNNEFTWQVYPNPSKGVFNLVYQLNEGENISVKVFDVNGKLIRQLKSTANGFIQKLTIDLQAQKLAAGLYLIQCETGDKKEVFKLIKQ